MKTNEIIEEAEDVSKWVADTLLTKDGIKDNEYLVNELMEAYSADDKPKRKKRTDKQMIKDITELLGGE